MSCFVKFFDRFVFETGACVHHFICNNLA